MSALSIAQYVEQAQRDPSTEHLEALWRAVFLRHAWHFLPSTNSGAATPLVAPIDGGHWILAFTSPRPLKAFARQQGRLNDDGSAPILSLTPLEAMNHILDVQDHIQGVIFNLGQEATFRAPTHALESYARHFNVPLDEGLS